MFIRYLDKITRLDVFKTWRKDPLLNVFDGIVSSNVFAFDQSYPNAISVYTDGSFDPRLIRAGYGISFKENPLNITVFCGRVPGKQSNNTGEIYAIIKALEIASLFTAPIHIFTDSQYTIDSLS